ATATPSDVDGDTVTLTYVWKVNGAAKQTATTTSTTNTFDLNQPGQGDPNQIVTVEVTPFDAFSNGAFASASATVQNSATNLQVPSAIVSNTGVSVHLNQPANLSLINLYDQSSSSSVGDVILRGNATGQIRGSLVFNATGDSFTFIKTG